MLTRAELRWGALGDVRLTGRTVAEVTAYGKHLLTRLAAEDRRPALTVHSHLKMDGRWFVKPTVAGERFGDHRIRAILGNGEWTAVGHLLGELHVLPTAEEGARVLARLGPDIMNDDFEPEGLARALDALAAVPERPIGAALLDQTVVAGIGTIFMAESLFVRRIWPWQATVEVDGEALLRTARDLLLKSVQTAPPTSDYGHRSHVHGRARLPCVRCGTPIRVAQIGDPPFDRPAFYCPTCQPAPPG